VDKEKITAFADLLFNSEQSRNAVPPLTEKDPSITVDDAYQIQLVNIQRAVGMGHVISGKKIGLTSEGIQKQLGVNEPDYGHLFAAMDCKDGSIKTDVLIQPKIEGEIAFILKTDLAGGKITREDVIAGTDYVAAAFEIVDSRVADWKIKLPDTISDNASSGRYVLGEKHLKLSEVDLPAVTMKLYKNGTLAGEGTGAAVLGDPCVSVAWLANCLWGYGVTLKKGEVILSGAFSAAPPAAKGDVFTAEFSSFGTVEARFV
jgi:2-keto-4-pentenoate hydratase